ncbi:MAG TPA: flagellar cap protein FliD N-terminal domain-containing protein, partial [Phycisphaerae bacterium]|nr:flagellar cap protein FliD N-terminal domain-containing protein [Phycisphaerae bacterium]
MSGISTGVGLISGINTSQLIQQLMAIESRPVQLLQKRVQDATAQRTAYMALSALLVAVKGAAAAFDEASFFRTARAVSSNTDVVTATATGTAMPGLYAFRVQSLAAASQLISAGMPDKDATPVGAGTLTIELGRGALDPATPLDGLNEGAGVHRGMIRITDRSGRSADIDLTGAITVDDVLRAINFRADISVKAAVRNDRIVLTDASGGTGLLTVADLGGGRTASDLGIAASTADDQIVGSPVFRLGAGSALSVLNDGNGVRRHGTLDDFAITTRSGESIAVNLSGRLRFTTRLEELNSGNGVRLGTIRITNRAGRSGTIDLSGARTIQDVVDAINTAADSDGTALQINASLVNASITITDASVAEGQKAASNLRIEDVSGYAARDLGIAADVGFRWAATDNGV